MSSLSLNERGVCFAAAAAAAGAAAAAHPVAAAAAAPIGPVAAAAGVNAAVYRDVLHGAGVVEVLMAALTDAAVLTDLLLVQVCVSDGLGQGRGMQGRGP